MLWLCVALCYLSSCLTLKIKPVFVWFGLTVLLLSLQILWVTASEDPLKDDGQDELCESAEDHRLSVRKTRQSKKRSIARYPDSFLIMQKVLLSSPHAQFPFVSLLNRRKWRCLLVSLSKVCFTPSEDVIGDGRLQLAVKVLYEDEDGTSFVITVFNESMLVVKTTLLSLMEFVCLAFWLPLLVLSFCGSRVSIYQAADIAAQENIEDNKESKVEAVDYDWLPESSLPEEWKQQKSKKLRKKRPVKAN
uniref:Translocon-associated protein subunit alpha n=1 Tax=Ditylenchus dipsaci TaxID=166011 RepID=A0A915CTJ4_9BILA